MSTKKTPLRTAAKTPVNQLVTIKFPSTEHQGQRDLFAVAETEHDGIQMGVLSDGTPFLTMRGLARLCGVDHTVVLRLTSDWLEEQEKPRGRRIKEILASQGYNYPFLYFMTNGTFGETHAYVDVVCMAILEYYAFDASQTTAEIAQRNYRLLARSSLRKFIYEACHYDPAKSLSDSWRNFHSRVLLNDQLPPGYFSIFKEVADLVVRMIQEGCDIDDHTVPDCSVGSCWSKHWEEQGLDAKYGARIKHEHFYPEWFPQSAVNPVPAWVYPDEGLAAFRRWMHETYIPTKFPNYVQAKVKKVTFLQGQAQKLLGAISNRLKAGDSHAS